MQPNMWAHAPHMVHHKGTLLACTVGWCYYTHTHRVHSSAREELDQQMLLSAGFPLLHQNSPRTFPAHIAFMKRYRQEVVGQSSEMELVGAPFSALIGNTCFWSF